MENSDSDRKPEVNTVTYDFKVEKTVEKNGFFRIDREMIRYKLHFLLYIGALGTALPYMSVFARNRIGLSATSYAAISSSQLLMMIFTKPLLGYIADYLNKLKLMICILTATQAVFLFLLLPIPHIEKEVAPDDTSFAHNGTFVSFECEFGHEMNNSLASPSSYHNLFTLNSSSNAKSNSSNSTSLSNAKRDRSICVFQMNDCLDIVEQCIDDEEVSTHESAFNNRTFELISGEGKTSCELLRNEVTVIYLDQNEQLFLTDSAFKNSTLSQFCNVCCIGTGECFNHPCAISARNMSSITTEVISDFRTYQFWLFALFTTVANVCINALFTLSDTACCETIKKTGAAFGKQRVFGAIGWGVMSFIGGFLNDVTGDFLLSWAVMATATLVALWNFTKVDLVRTQFSQNIIRDIGKILSSPEFLAYEAGVFLNGVNVGVIWFYLMWFMVSIGANTTLCGLAHVVQCFIGEIPFMVFSDWIVSKVGYFAVLTMSLAAYCGRYFCYSVIHDPWWILPVEVFHGVTYGVLYTAMASYAKISAKPGTEATTQSIIFTTHEGLGAGLGVFLAGVGFDVYGAHQTFHCYSIFAGCGMVLIAVFTFCFLQRKETQSVPETADT